MNIPVLILFGSYFACLEKLLVGSMSSEGQNDLQFLTVLERYPSQRECFQEDTLIPQLESTDKSYEVTKVGLDSWKTYFV